MAESFEKSLRHGMEALGRVVESLIGKAKQARVQVSTRGGVQPILSLESQLEPLRIREVIEASAQKVLSGAIPDLNGGEALEVGEGPAAFGSRMLACHAKAALGVEIGGGSVARQGDISRGFTIRAQLMRLPFADNRFSYFLARLATQFAGDMVRNARELSRVLTPGGQGMIVDYHPFGLYAKHGAGRVRSADSGVHRIEDYYRLCRQAGLRIVDVREVFIDEGMRQLFGEQEIGAYRNLKGTPLLIFIFVYKPKGKS
ncbi:MAG: methyltransferase domain-containing protein [Pseudomonadota bacterium]